MHISLINVSNTVGHWFLSPLTVPCIRSHRALAINLVFLDVDSIDLRGLAEGKQFTVRNISSRKFVFDR